MRQAQQLADQEKKVQDDVQQLAQSGAAGANGQQQQQQQLRQQIAEQKGAMADGVKNLKSQLDKLALDEPSRSEGRVTRARVGGGYAARPQGRREAALHAAAVARRRRRSG